MGFNMSYLERAITDGHAKLTGEGKQQAVPALNGGQRDFSLSASTVCPSLAGAGEGGAAG